ncbi:MAG: hypothetical protein M1537_06110 [Nitrospirae bacterium]|nr:hypothetical protein [Nitrospirota bacterium]MCL5285320.1 hypothetical protein [Nitrospirota bacterium]
MESLSIAPAVALMRPALFPFLLVLAFLILSGFLPERLRSQALLPDLVVLSGLLLSFFLFDPGSIENFFNPARPMDWIPLLATATFLLRTILPPARTLLSQALLLLASLLLLMLPLLRQEPLFKGLASLAWIYGPWIGIRALYPADGAKGLDTTFLLPPFFTAAAFSFLSPLSGSLLIGQLAGGLASVFGAMALASWTGKIRVSAIEPGWMLGALLVIGLAYADISAEIISCLAGSLFFGALAGRFSKRFRGGGEWRKTVFVAGFSCLPLVAGILVALKNLKNQGGGY